jgi:hypothetical protein
VLVQLRGSRPLPFLLRFNCLQETIHRFSVSLGSGLNHQYTIIIYFDSPQE